MTPRNSTELQTAAFADLELQTWPHQWQPSKEFPTPQSANVDEFTRVASDAMSFETVPSSFRLGDPKLPVALYRDVIVDTIMNNRRSVISGETGCGKSSQLGLMLAEAGAPRMYITQPRIISARELLGRARHNLGPDHEHEAGYLTGDAADSDCSPDARLIYVTEQLLFKMANRGQLNPTDIVINDEAHERTLSTTILLGLLKEIKDIKIVISSATIDTEKFSNYLKDPVTGEPAPVLILPGRTHPTKHIRSEDTVADAMRKLMAEGSNVLAFEPGVTRMRATKAKAASRRHNENVHVLYGDQSPIEQKTALTSADGNHIIATSIAETSLTPDGKDAVVDSGLSNVAIYTHGVKGLRTVFSSQSTMVQRAGRVGRTKPGTYVIAVPEDAPPPPDYEDRPIYETPAIQTTSVASFILELLSKGRKLENLDLIDDPNPENLRYDHLLLKRIGATALIGEEVVLTPVGYEMTDLALDVPLARMVVEARSLELEDGPVDRTALRLQVAAIAAIRQVKGILDLAQNSSRKYMSTKMNNEIASNERSSDILFELDIFAALFSKQQQMTASGTADVELQFERFLVNNDIIPNRYYKAVRAYSELTRRDSLDPQELRRLDTLERKYIKVCQLSGVEEIFVKRGQRTYRGIRGESRDLGRQSSIALPIADLVMGQAFDFQGLKTSGRFERRFITAASAVSLDLILDHVPNRVSEHTLGFVVSKKGTFAERKRYYFDGELAIGEEDGSLAPTLASRTALITAMMTGVGPSAADPLDTVVYNPGTPNATQAIKRWHASQALEHRSHVNLNTQERYASLIRKVVRASLEVAPLTVVDPAQLDAVIPNVFVNSLIRPTRKKDLPEIIRQSPDAIIIPLQDDKKRYIPVTYRNSTAYIIIERDLVSSISRADFTELLQYHDIKLKIGSNKYMQFDAAFDHIERLQQSREEKRARRVKEVETVATNTAEGNGPVEEYGRKQHDSLQAIILKAIKQRRAGTKPPKLVRRSLTRIRRGLPAPE